MELSAFDLGWLVGILEGEGCFSTRTQKDKKGKTYSYRRVHVTCSSSDLDVLEKIKDITGMGFINQNVRKNPRLKKNGEPVKPEFQWNLSNHAQIKTLLRIIYPYMGYRRQAKIFEINKELFNE